VQNPETLAHLALIARHGPAWFREAGTHDHPGTALLTVSGAVAQPGLQEIPCGTPLSAVLDAAGGTTEPLRAVLVGGYHGTWIDGGRIHSLTLDDPALAEHGATLGAGVVVALGRSACPARELAETFGWLADQSAGQCGPCANGLPAIAGVLADLVDGYAAPGGRELLQRWSSQVAGRGACRLPDGAVRFLQSGMRVFAAELREHERRGPCSACRRPTTLSVPATRRAAA
jgi:NADH:ubiquinone oxidoreductase subunit F (NADH-binding)